MEPRPNCLSLTLIRRLAISHASSWPVEVTRRYQKMLLYSSGSVTDSSTGAYLPSGPSLALSESISNTRRVISTARHQKPLSRTPNFNPLFLPEN